MALLVVLVAAVVVLVMRAAAVSGDPSRARRPRAARPRPQRPARIVGPDDDPEFLRELQRRTRRDDSPA